MLGAGENMENYDKFYPKTRTGKECRKTDCDRHNDYVAWRCGTGGSSLDYCMNCKNAHVSQYKRKVPGQSEPLPDHVAVP
jgi:hypothetical protein